MRKQQQVWELEHKSAASIPKLASTIPSSDVVRFIEYLKNKDIHLAGKVVDIGCGKGRNTIYLAKQGFEVYGLDYIKYALDITLKLAQEKNVTDKIHLLNADIDTNWPFSDNYFDIAVDCFASIDIETYAGRLKCREEMRRTLKRGGYAFITAVSVEDELEKKLMQISPGQEKNSVVWPKNKKFQKNYTANELKNFYNDYKLIEFREMKEPVTKLGKRYSGVYFWMILQKQNL